MQRPPVSLNVTTNGRKQLAQQLAETKTLNVKAITAKLNRDMTREDFDAVKAALTEEIAGMDAEAETIELLTKVMRKSKCSPQRCGPARSSTNGRRYKAHSFQRVFHTVLRMDSFVLNENELHAVG